MYTGLLHAHSGLRWIVLVLFILSIVKAFSGNENSIQKDKKIFTMTMGFMHLQVVIGLVLFFISDAIKHFLTWEMKDIMASSVARFFVVEHITMMVLAAIFVTVGHSKFKKAQNWSSKYKAIKIFYIVALVLILLAIPWPFRGEIGRAWF